MNANRLPGLRRCPAMVLILTFWTLACSHGDHEPNLVERIKQTEGLPKSMGFEANAVPEGVIAVDGAPPEMLVYTQSRRDHLTRFPCQQCHPVAKSTGNGPKAHWDITLQHGQEGLLTCRSCHGLPSVQPNLQSMSGEPVAFDHSYNLCGQCHFQQKRDWLGGAHGKRVQQWAGPKVIRNCTACHDPHQPLFEQRWPSYNAQPFE